jgi:hypothetical protein
MLIKIMNPHRDQCDVKMYFFIAPIASFTLEQRFAPSGRQPREIGRGKWIIRISALTCIWISDNIKPPHVEGIWTKSMPLSCMLYGLNYYASKCLNTWQIGNCRIWPICHHGDCGIQHRHEPAERNRPIVCPKPMHLRNGLPVWVKHDPPICRWLWVGLEPSQIHRFCGCGWTVGRWEWWCLPMMVRL